MSDEEQRAALHRTRERALRAAERAEKKSRPGDSAAVRETKADWAPLVGPFTWDA